MHGHILASTAEDGNSVEEGIAICLYCKRSVVARNSNTSNLFSHLRTQHPAKYELAMKAKKKAKGKGKATGTSPRSGIQNLIDESFAQMKRYDRKSKRWQRLTDAVTYYLAKDMVPFYTVEKPGFKQLVGVFDKQYDLPSSKYFSQTAIPSLYSSIRDKVAEEISKVEYFSATTDLWSSEGTKPYLSYTIHYIY